MPRQLEKVFWVDTLHRKHECGPYLGDPICLEVLIEGESFDVWMPEEGHDFHRLRIERAVEGGGLLFIIASYSLEEDDPDGRGIVMAAKRHEDGRYIVH